MKEKLKNTLEINFKMFDNLIRKKFFDSAKILKIINYFIEHSYNNSQFAILFFNTNFHAILKFFLITSICLKLNMLCV